MIESASSSCTAKGDLEVGLTGVEEADGEESIDFERECRTAEGRAGAFAEVILDLDPGPLGLPYIDDLLPLLLLELNEGRPSSPPTKLTLLIRSPAPI